MAAFRVLLFVLIAILAIYTGIVIANQGVNLLPIFFGDIGKFEWPGQFNLDFLFMLVLSATWVAWRHHFSIGGCCLSLLALFFGSAFLTIYLLLLSWQEKGDVRKMLLGDR